MPASKELQWKPEEDALIRKMITNGVMLKNMTIQLPHRTRRAIECRVANLKLKSGNPRTKYSKNENFWETPAPLNCYYAGIIAADGSVNTKVNNFQWTCEVTDKKYMENFINACEYTGRIREYFRRSPASNNVSIHCSLRIGSCKKWNEDLNKNFSIVPRKAYRISDPKLKNDYLKCCFLIGYTDGDGCIYVGKNGKITVRYVSASKEIIYWIRRFTEEKFKFQIKRKNKSVFSSKNGNYHAYSLCGIMAVKFVEFMRRIDVPRFSRKWDNPDVVTIIESYRKKWPEFFTSDQELSFDQFNNIVRAKKCS